MVKLFDIVRNKNIVACCYSPEDSNLKGYIEIDAETRNIINVKYSDYEYGKKMYAFKVYSKLCKLIESGKPLPKTAAVVWY